VIGILVASLVTVATQSRDPPDSAAACASPREAAHFARAYRDFGRELDSVRALLHIPGLAAAITCGDGIAWRATLGLADVERDRPVTADTRFPIASLTKTMVAVVLMQLVHERKLSLETDLDSGVRVVQVLSHTSELGDEYLYSGARFNALGDVVERAGGQPLVQALETRIFDPAGMTHTVAPKGPADTVTDVAEAYDYDAQSPTQLRPGTPAIAATRAASGVISTANDLARYVIALDRGQLLGPDELTEMTTPRRSANGTILPYALGWFSQVYLGERIWWHYGQEVSYASLLLWLPRRHMALTVLTNTAAMSDAARLLEGNVARSVVAQAFFRTVAALHGERELTGDDRIATALADVYLGARDRADSLARRAFTGAPELARTPDLALLFLLARLDDRALDGVARRIADTVLRAHPKLPTALYFSSVLAQQAGDPARATVLLERLAALRHPPRHYSVVFGLLDLGVLQITRDPPEARAALERVIDMNWNLSGAVDSAKRVLARNRS
jgi:CubicO group peptidase (beta-lactamase class C family)